MVESSEDQRAANERLQREVQEKQRTIEEIREREYEVKMQYRESEEKC